MSSVSLVSSVLSLSLSLSLSSLSLSLFSLSHTHSFSRTLSVPLLCASRASAHALQCHALVPPCRQIFLKMVGADSTSSPGSTASTRPHWTAYVFAYMWQLLSLAGAGGLHHFWLGNVWRGVLWLLTYNLLLVGWLWDLFTMPSLVQEAHDRRGRVGCCGGCCVRRRKRVALQQQAAV